MMQLSTEVGSRKIKTRLQRSNAMMMEKNKVETISPMGLYAQCGEKIAEVIRTRLLSRKR